MPYELANAVTVETHAKQLMVRRLEAGEVQLEPPCSTAPHLHRGEVAEPGCRRPERLRARRVSLDLNAHTPALQPFSRLL